MFLKHNSLIIGLSLACIALPSCVDDKYDLSDIDTTVRVDVNELTLPINLDEIKLKSILKEGDRIKIIDGHYMVIENGDFSSKAVFIDPVLIKSQSIAMPAPIKLPYVPGLVTGDVELEFNTPASEFGFSANNIPAEITAIDAVGSNLEFKFSFNVDGLNGVARSSEFRDLVLQLPKGLTISDASGGTYNAETGELNMPTLQPDNGNISFVIKADHADFVAMGATFEYPTHTFAVKGDINVKSGKLVLKNLVEGGSATELKINISYEVPDFNLTTFSGGLQYDFEGVNFSDIKLDGMPDLLAQSGTNLLIANPCIFLKVNNPLQSYGMYAQTGFTITASHNEQLTSYSIDNPYFTIGNNHSDGLYAYCLSPKQPTSVPEGYENAEHVAYTSLSDVLSNAGNPENGMPSVLAVKLDNPQIPNQKIVDMPLGQALDEVRGSYEFRAPIALEEGSAITYEETVTGWGSDDFDYITITQLDIDAKLACDIPLALDIEAYPVDKEGNVINNVRIEGVHINAGSEPQDVHIHITGNITGFDGIRYVAKATAGAGDQVLSTDMNIRVLNLRPTVSGYYMKDL